MFEEKGFFKEYYIENKFVGIVNGCIEDREIGYIGMREEIIKEDTVMTNGKKLKAGTITRTIIYPLSGKRHQNEFK